MESFIKHIREKREIENSVTSSGAPAAEPSFMIKLMSFKKETDQAIKWIEEHVLDGNYEIARRHIASLGNQLSKLYECTEEMEKKDEDCGCIENITAEEFDKFLIDIGGLENGHYPDKGNIYSCRTFEIGPGWYGLVKTLIEKACAAGWNKQVCQVKEKFGGLRFYINDASEEVHKIISEHETLSYKICEQCGEPGEKRSGGWIRTLCDTCHQTK